MIIHIQKEKLHKDFETIGEPRFVCLYVSFIDRVSTVVRCLFESYHFPR